MALKFANNNSLSAITALPASVSGGALNLISTSTASSSSTIDITSGIDSTYKEYFIKFINIHPATDNVNFTFNMSVDGGSNYNVTKTTTFFTALHNEADSEAFITYASGEDLAQSTAFQQLSPNSGNGADENISGTLTLFNPSSTTFVKHFITNFNSGTYHDFNRNEFVAGYGNTTSSIDAVQFKFSSGNIDSGTIKMYGVV